MGSGRYSQKRNQLRGIVKRGLRIASRQKLKFPRDSESWLVRDKNAARARSAPPSWPSDVRVLHGRRLSRCKHGGAEPKGPHFVLHGPSPAQVGKHRSEQSFPDGCVSLKLKFPTTIGSYFGPCPWAIPVFTSCAPLRHRRSQPGINSC